MSHVASERTVLHAQAIADRGSALTWMSSGCTFSSSGIIGEVAVKGA